MTATILLAMTGPAAKAGLALFRALAPEHDVRGWPDNVGDMGEITYACAWRPPVGLFARLPHLKGIISLAAGVDHILADPHLPDVPVVRAVQPDVARRMVEYIVLHVLAQHRQQRDYDCHQEERQWRQLPVRRTGETVVGIMGLGTIGIAAAKALTTLGFKVIGWSKTPKRVPAVTAFAGNAELNAFLASAHYLVCLLPHTRETDGILNRELFARLPQGAYLINVARGSLQVEADILSAIEQGQLSGAALDVFAIEPLVESSPLWSHPRIVITPHVAGYLDPSDYVLGALAQIMRMECGLAPEGVVDRQKGY